MVGGLNKWKKVRELTRTQWILLVKATVILLLIKTSMVALPFSQLKKTYARLLHVTNPGTYPEEYIAAAVWAIRAVAPRLPLGLSCLPQALALKYLLRRDPDMPLHIGVQTAASQGFQAHAWIEKDGHIVIGNWPQETNYRPIWVWE